MEAIRNAAFSIASGEYRMVLAVGVEKMREVILAVRAIWDCWQNQTRLNFQGEFFRLTLMTPFFSPAPHGYHHIPIFVAGVNPRMCQLAGELCQGFRISSVIHIRSETGAEAQLVIQRLDPEEGNELIESASEVQMEFTVNKKFC